MSKIGMLKILVVILILVIGVEFYLLFTFNSQPNLPEQPVENNVTVEPQKIVKQPDSVNRGFVYINEQSGLEEAQATLVYKGKVVNVVIADQDGSAANNFVTLSLQTLNQTNPKNYDIILDKGQLEATSVFSLENEKLTINDLSIGDKVKITMDVDLVNTSKPLYSIIIVLVE